MRGILAGAAALSIINSARTAALYMMDVPIVDAMPGPIHRRGRFKPHARKVATQLSKRAGRRRQQGRG